MSRNRFFFIPLLILLVALLPARAYATTLIGNNLVQVDSATNLQTFYLANNGQSANTTHFGAYAFHAVGDTLYIGLANYRPADAGSALLAKYTGGSITFVGNLVDEGVNEIVTTADGGILIGGVDPHESWALGNVYTYKNDTFTKVRTGNGLENVIHMWGIDSRSDGTLYAAVSSHDGSYPGTCVNGVSCFGEIFKSVNNGATWTQVSRLGDYRVFDVITYNSKLYALYVDEVTGDNRLAVSSNDGQNWTILKSDGALRRTHMVTFRGSLLFLGGGTTSNVLYSMDTAHTITQHNLPFNVGISYGDAAHFSNYNQFVVARDGFLYTISSSGDIWRTHNLTNWAQVTESSDEYVSIGYWSNPNKILVSTRGASAKIYELDLDDISARSITRIPPRMKVKDIYADVDAGTGSGAIAGPGREIRLMTQADVVVADITVDLTDSRSWEGTTAFSDVEAGKGGTHGLVGLSGNASSYTLYIPMPEKSLGTHVRLCPNAQTAEEVDYKCAGGVDFVHGETRSVNGADVTVTSVLVNGARYWKAVGVTGTGGVDTSPRSAGYTGQATDSYQSRESDVDMNKGGRYTRNSLDVMVSEGTTAFPAYISVQQHMNAIFNMNSYRKVGDVHEVWLKSMFNDARILKPLKPSTLSVPIPYDPHVKSSNMYYSLAYSSDMRKWKTMKNVVVDKANRMLHVATPIGGYYAVVRR